MIPGPNGLLVATGLRTNGSKGDLLENWREDELEEDINTNVPRAFGPAEPCRNKGRPPQGSRVPGRVPGVLI